MSHVYKEGQRVIAVSEIVHSSRQGANKWVVRQGTPGTVQGGRQCPGDVRVAFDTVFWREPQAAEEYLIVTEIEIAPYGIAISDSDAVLTLRKMLHLSEMGNMLATSPTTFGIIYDGWRVARPGCGGGVKCPSDGDRVRRAIAALIEWRLLSQPSTPPLSPGEKGQRVTAAGQIPDHPLTLAEALEQDATVREHLAKVEALTEFVTAQLPGLSCPSCNGTGETAPSITCAACCGTGEGEGGHA